MGKKPDQHGDQDLLVDAQPLACQIGDEENQGKGEQCAHDRQQPSFQ